MLHYLKKNVFASFLLAGTNEAISFFLKKLMFEIAAKEFRSKIPRNDDF